jgi:PAS domain S-box-containing protein
MEGMISRREPEERGRGTAVDEGVRILVLDHRPENVATIRAALDGLGTEAVEAASAEEALRLLEQDEFAAVLLGRDELETARLIRTLRQVPLLFVAESAPYALGAVDFIPAPPHPDALRSKLGILVELYRCQKAARESRERYDTIAELAPVGVFHTGPEGNCLWVNPRWCELAGMGPDEALGRGWVNAIHPDDRARVFDECSLAAREGRPFRAEYRFLHPDGKITWVLGQAKTEGRGGGCVGTVTDMTALREAREALERRVEERTQELRREQDRVRLVIDQVPALIAYVDRDERYVYVNRGYETWFGRPAEAVRGKHVRDIVGPEPYERIRGPIEAVLRGELVGYEKEMPFRTGRRVVRAAYVPHRAATGEILGFVSLVTDITERKAEEERAKFLSEASAALSSSLDFEETIRKVSELAIGGIADGCVVDLAERGGLRRLTVAHRDPKKVAVARAYRERHPIDPDQPFGVPQVLRTGRSELYEQMPEEILRRSARDDEELCMLRELGITSCMVVPILGGGRILGALTLVSTRPDRTYGRVDLALAEELGRRAGLAVENARLYREVRILNEGLEERVKERTAELELALDELNAFAYTVAHDLRTPLRTMRRFSDVLLADHGEGLHPEARDFLGRIGAAAGRMDTLIQDLLSYSQVGRTAFQIVPVELDEVLRDALSELAQELDDRKGRIEIEEPLPRVLGDPTFLSQVFSNLFGNAVKFVPRDRAPRVRVWAEGRGDRMRIWIEDNGIGIDPAYRDRLFRVFERLQNDYPGTGIGLAIVKRAVERMGGSAGFEPGDGEGTRFWIDLRPAP